MFFIIAAAVAVITACGSAQAGSHGGPRKAGALRARLTEVAPVLGEKEKMRMRERLMREASRPERGPRGERPPGDRDGAPGR